VLLGLLLRFPELAGLSLDAGEGHRLPLTELHPPASFRLSGHREIADALFSLLEPATGSLGQEMREGGGRRSDVPLLSMASLMSEVVRADLRQLASGLYVDAERRSGGRADRALPLLQQASTDLHDVRRRVDVRHESIATGPLDPASAAELLNRLRSRGHDPAAISHLARR
jgi:hypothetical protein